jgi:hypothetical protein
VETGKKEETGKEEEVVGAVGSGPAIISWPNLTRTGMDPSLAQGHPMSPSKRLESGCPPAKRQHLACPIANFAYFFEVQDIKQTRSYSIIKNSRYIVSLKFGLC